MTSPTFSRFASIRPVSSVLAPWALALSLAVAPLFLSALPANASTIDDLNAKKAQLEQQQKQDAYNALQQKSIAERAAAKLQQVSGQIDSLQSTISSTQDSIRDTQDNIGQQDQKMAGLQSDLRKIQDQEDLLVRQLYIMAASQPDSLALFTNESVSKKEEDNAQFTALKAAASALADKTKIAQQQVQETRNQLVEKKRSLEGLKDQQTEQQQGLAAVQQQQADLKDNAEETEARLEAKAKAEEIAQNKIEDQISAELAAIIAARSKGGNGAINGGQNSGQRVSQGAIVGHEGSTGNSTGPHVHFECRKNNVAVNCLPYVSNGTLTYPISNFIISQYFGETANSAMYHGSPHSGTDLAGPYGSAVHAPADGTVILNKWYGDYGNAWAEQLDNGLVVLLGHMTGN